MKNYLFIKNHVINVQLFFIQTGKKRGPRKIGIFFCNEKNIANKSKEKNNNKMYIGWNEGVVEPYSQ